MEDLRVYVAGLDQFRSDLRRAERDLPKRLAQANRRIGQIVVDEAQRRYRRYYTTRTGRTVQSIRATAQQRHAQIKFAGARVPWGLGQEFGSDRLKRFAPWTGTGPGGAGSHGRFVYPAAREKQPEIREQMWDIVMDVMEGPFPE